MRWELRVGLARVMIDLGSQSRKTQAVQKRGN
jgi:hypothetical protein